MIRKVYNDNNNDTKNIYKQHHTKKHTDSMEKKNRIHDDNDRKNKENDSNINMMRDD